MKVLHINESDLSGGAALAAYRLHDGLRKQLVESFLLVDSPSSADVNVNTIQRKRLAEKLTGYIPASLGLNYINILSTGKIKATELYKNIDILNFHNLHGGYFNYLFIPQLTREKPAIFTLHDMWSFTGHCAYSFDCDRWKTGCGKCPHLDIYPAVSRDSTALEWKLKQWVYSQSNLSIVAPSAWLAKLAKQSLLGQFSVHHIPYGINTSVYKPLDPSWGRNILEISAEKTVLLFTAQNLRDPRKGFDLLVAALKELPTSLRSNLVLLTMGNGGDALSSIADIPVLSLGYVGGDRLKALIYSAADIFVFPTRTDNLPVVLQESMACGTPMVSFQVGGVPELVRPDLTGLLAEAENSKELAFQLLRLIEDKDLRKKMAFHCRQIAINEYSLEKQAQGYIDLYRQTLDSFHNKN